MFKVADKKLMEVGFTKTSEDAYGVFYEREDKEYKYIQVIAILHKKSGRHIVQSYDKNLFDTRNIGCTNVGMSAYELQWCYRKMKELGWAKTSK